MAHSQHPRSPLPTRPAEYRVFEALGESCGVMVTDRSTGACVFRFRRDWEDFAGAEAEVLAAICEDLPEKQREMGTQPFLEWIDTSLSGTFRVEPPSQTICADLEWTAQALYRRLVKSTVREYKTHLPLIPIDLAAGKLGQDRATGVKEWIEAEVPGRRGLSEDLFIVRIRGRSMEPDIPDGSLCVFRSYYGGSRTGGIYIVQRIATHDEGGEFTIKRYASRKQKSGDEWEHAQIHMRPDNPEFEAWDLKEEDRYVTIAEFVSVLEDPVA